MSSMMGVLNNEDVRMQFAQDEVTHQRQRVGSKKSVQQGRAWFSVSRRGPPLFYARSVLRNT
jgi:hypothetical protein